jgi:hypothetical protein
MSTVTIAVDLAKNVVELDVAGRAGSIRERKRLSRPVAVRSEDQQALIWRYSGDQMDPGQNRP